MLTVEQDQELKALGELFIALEPLNDEARIRLIAYIADKYVGGGLFNVLINRLTSALNASKLQAQHEAQAQREQTE